MSHSDKSEGAAPTGHFRHRDYMKRTIKNVVLRQMVKSRFSYKTEDMTATLLLECFTL